MRERRRELRIVIPERSPLVRLADIVGLPEEIGVHPRLADALAGAPTDGASSSGA
jgi:hypothetical protein